MIIAETCSFEIGPFIVRQRPRFDNPAFSSYTVFRGDQVIGKSFSRPDLSCCEWLERQRGVYATPEETRRRGPCHHANAGGKSTQKLWGGKRGRPTNAEREQREAALLQETPEEPASIDL